MQIRDAIQTDFPQITAIYHEILAHSTAIYSNQPATIEDRTAWGKAVSNKVTP